MLLLVGKKGAIDINIITAEEARKISSNCIPNEISQALTFVMAEIVESAIYGDNKIFLYEDDYSKEIFSQINSETFFRAMKNYGYKVKKELKEYCSHFYYKITISW